MLWNNKRGVLAARRPSFCLRSRWIFSFVKTAKTLNFKKDSQILKSSKVNRPPDKDKLLFGASSSPKTPTLKMISREQTQSRFRRFAWVSAYLSLLTGVSHVRAFPSYNLIISTFALFAGVQDEKEAILKHTSVCAVIGSVSLVTDIIFCSVWAGDVRQITKTDMFVFKCFSSTSVTTFNHRSLRVMLEWSNLPCRYSFSICL